jgi:hypothetical protein
MSIYELTPEQKIRQRYGWFQEAQRLRNGEKGAPRSNKKADVLFYFAIWRRCSLIWLCHDMFDWICRDFYSTGSSGASKRGRSSVTTRIGGGA